MNHYSCLLTNKILFTVIHESIHLFLCSTPCILFIIYHFSNPTIFHPFKIPTKHPIITLSNSAYNTRSSIYNRPCNMHSYHLYLNQGNQLNLPLYTPLPLFSIPFLSLTLHAQMIQTISSDYRQCKAAIPHPPITGGKEKLVEYSYIILPSFTKPIYKYLLILCSGLCDSAVAGFRHLYNKLINKLLLLLLLILKE